jgi:hypothetical protein
MLVEGWVGRSVGQLVGCFIIYLFIYIFIHLFAELKQDALHLQPCTFMVQEASFF